MAREPGKDEDGREFGKLPSNPEDVEEIRRLTSENEALLNICGVALQLAESVNVGSGESHESVTMAQRIIELSKALAACKKFSRNESS